MARSLVKRHRRPIIRAMIPTIMTMSASSGRLLIDVSFIVDVPFIAAAAAGEAAAVGAPVPCTLVATSRWR